MKRALIASSSVEYAAFIEQFLRNEGIIKISCALSGNEARRFIMSDTKPELIIISTPLSDEFGQELSITAAEYTSSKVILICESDISDDIAETVSEFGVTVISKDSNRQSLSDAVRAAAESHQELHGSEKENSDILIKIDDMRLINRAKCRLMQYLNFTEHQAHKYIEKQAMNNRQTRREAAEKILAAYDK